MLILNFRYIELWQFLLKSNLLIKASPQCSCTTVLCAEVHHRWRAPASQHLNPLPQPVAMPRHVLFIGDSHTRGRLGSNYVTKLQSMVQDTDLLLSGHGVDGEPTERIAQRVAPLLKKYPDPAAVFLLAGSNDCIAREHPAMQHMYKWAFRLSTACTLQNALNNMQGMLDYILKTVPDAQITVITLPPLAENPSFPAHQRVEQYNNRLKQLISSSYPTVRVCDYFTAAVDYLQRHSPAYAQYRPMADGTEPTKQRRSLFDSLVNCRYSFSMLNFLGRQLTAVLQHILLRRSWDSISRARGLYVLTDWVHMNDTAAGLLADVLLPFVKSL